MGTLSRPLKMETLTGLNEESLLSMYQNLHSKCCFVPSCHFNERVVKADKESYYKQEAINESKQRSSEAQQRVLAAIHHLAESGDGPDGLGPMFVVSNPTFENILTARVGLKRQAKSEPNSEKRFKGEVSILIISKKHGLIMFDVKAVGDITDYGVQKRHIDIKNTVEKFLKKVDSKRKWASWLINHLGLDVPVTVVLALPNVCRREVRSIFGSSSDLEENLSRGVPGNDSFRTRCLCADELPSPNKSADPDTHRLEELRGWFVDFTTSLGKTTPMSDQQYMTCVAAFVGPKSRITIWSPLDKRVASHRRHVRTQDESVHETGARFAMHVLRPEQERVLESGVKYAYLSGPPGCGKTMLLIHKAVKWIVEENRHVVIVTADFENNTAQPVAMEIKAKIEATLSRHHQQERRSHSLGLRIHTPTSSEHVSLCMGQNAPSPRSVVKMAADAVRRVLPSDGGNSYDENISQAPISFLLDEVYGDKTQAVIRLLKKTFKDAPIWCAGPWRKDKPAGFEVLELPECLRCPPAVQVVLSKTERDCQEQHKTYSYTLSSTELGRMPLPCDGPPVTWLSHEDHNCPVYSCFDCGQSLARYLRHDLRVGTGSLKPSDVLIVTARISLAHTPFLSALRREGLPVRVVEPGSGREDLSAFQSENEVLVTDISLVAGLERMVVVYVPDRFNMDMSASGRRRSGSKNLSSNGPPQQSQILSGLGRDNRSALWYTLSRCLSQAVVIHFGPAEVTKTDDVTSSSSEEEEEEDVEDDDEVRDGDNDDGNLERSSRGRFSTQVSDDTDDKRVWSLFMFFVLVFPLLCYLALSLLALFSSENHIVW